MKCAAEVFGLVVHKNFKQAGACTRIPTVFHALWSQEHHLKQITVRNCSIMTWLTQFFVRLTIAHAWTVFSQATNFEHLCMCNEQLLSFCLKYPERVTWTISTCFSKTLVIVQIANLQHYTPISSTHKLPLVWFLFPPTYLVFLPCCPPDFKLTPTCAL